MVLEGYCGHNFGVHRIEVDGYSEDEYYPHVCFYLNYLDELDIFQGLRKHGSEVFVDSDDSMLVVKELSILGVRVKGVLAYNKTLSIIPRCFIWYNGFDFSLVHVGKEFIDDVAYPVLKNVNYII